LLQWAGLTLGASAFYQNLVYIPLRSRVIEDVAAKAMQMSAAAPGWQVAVACWETVQLDDLRDSCPTQWAAVKDTGGELKWQIAEAVAGRMITPQPVQPVPPKEEADRDPYQASMKSIPNAFIHSLTLSHYPIDSLTPCTL
jgi:hypothetical protein